MINLNVKDAIGKTCQCSTVQCDFNLPKQFDLEYVIAKGMHVCPIMVHRMLFGSLKQFFGILVKNCAGELPFWLALVQMRLLPVTATVYDSTARASHRRPKNLGCVLRWIG